MGLPGTRGCYAFVKGETLPLGYSPDYKRLLCKVLKEAPHMPWPKDDLLAYDEKGTVLRGSPMLDAKIDGEMVDEEMVDWIVNSNI